MHILFASTLLLALVACAPFPRDQIPAVGGAAGMEVAHLPVEGASIRGTITQIDPMRGIRIETDPSQASGPASGKAVVKLTGDARVLHRDGRAALPTDLAVGQTVSAWFTGPVMKSYPLQASARMVVIEP